MAVSEERRPSCFDAIGFSSGSGNNSPPPAATTAVPSGRNGKHIPNALA